MGLVSLGLREKCYLLASDLVHSSILNSPSSLVAEWGLYLKKDYLVNIEETGIYLTGSYMLLSSTVLLVVRI